SSTCRPGALNSSSARAHQGAPSPHLLSDTSGSPWNGCLVATDLGGPDTYLPAPPRNPYAPTSTTLNSEEPAKHYQTKKKGAAHMGDSLTSLTLEAPPNPAHRVGVCSKPHLV